VLTDAGSSPAVSTKFCRKAVFDPELTLLVNSIQNQERVNRKVGPFLWFIAFKREK